MNGNSLLVQVGIAGIGVAIILTFIQPTLTTIKELEQQITDTETETETIEQVNESLFNLVERANSISQRDKTLLRTYLPDTIDEVLVLKHLSAIAAAVEVDLSELSYEGEERSDRRNSDTSTTDLPYAHTFSVGFVSTYESLKSFLTLLEQNNYPLDVYSASINPSEGGLLDVSLQLSTYSHLAGERS